MKIVEKRALELLDLEAHPRGAKEDARIAELRADEMVRFALLDSQANVLCPAAKLWNTGHGATMMREAVSLMGGYGITEDCPGFLGKKWMDAQLEATYEGPEAVQRRQLSVTMANAALPGASRRPGSRELRHVAAVHPGTGACALASAYELWLWTYRHLEGATDADGGKLLTSPRQGVTFKLADALAWLMAARAADPRHRRGSPRRAARCSAEALPGTARFFADLCHVQAARAAGEVGAHLRRARLRLQPPPGLGRGGRRACWGATEADALEGLVPGLAGCAMDVARGRRRRTRTRRAPARRAGGSPTSGRCG